MASFCLPKAAADAFLDALKTGDIDPVGLLDVPSEDRRAAFAKVVGEANAADVNALFESKILLKDQMRGLATWAKSVGGITEPAKLDFLSKVGRLERVLDPAEEREFLADLAAQKLGMGVTFSEAKSIAKGAKTVAALRDAWNPSKKEWTSEDARLKYGAAFVEYQKYVGELMRDAKKLTYAEWMRNPGKAAIELAAASKGIVASLDNSFFGRQGAKMLYTHPDIWAKGFAKSWSDIAETLKGGDPMDALKAEILSRPNAMNGKYKNAKVAVGIDFEEAFPTSLPERIPGFGRLYKASESAFTGGALRFRADLADRLIARAERAGVDMSAGGQAEGIGKLVNAMTGRGHLGVLTEGQANAVNATFFSLRFLKSNFDTLTGHRLGFAIEKGPARDFVRKEAAKNLARIVGGMAGVLFIAGQLWPGSVETDPASSNFGRIQIGNTRFDISGGMGSLVTLAARLTPIRDKNGKWHMWSKSSTTGRFTDLLKGGYGARTALDVVEDFAEGKLSPLAGTLRDSLQGEIFGGKPMTVESAIANLVKPIGVSSIEDAMNTPDAAPLLAVIILDGLGIGASSYSSHKAPKDPRQIWDMEVTP